MSAAVKDLIRKLWKRFSEPGERIARHADDPTQDVSFVR